MKIEEFLNYLKNVKKVRENQYMALCPAHNDKNPSLSIGLSENKNQILLHCYAGCSADDVLNTVGLKKKDLFNNKGDFIMNKTSYTYYNADGTIAYTKTRIDNADKTKQFYFEQPDCKRNLQGVNRVPYNLLAVLNAQTVYFVEGEKCADAVIKQGFVATTLDNGANSKYERY